MHEARPHNSVRLDARLLEKIYRTVARVPPGRVVSYGRVADLAGIPGRARLVGYALRQLPAGRAIPWHRVINASGRISFPAGSAKYHEQRQRLEEDGVAFVGGRVNLKHHGWAQSLDELLWGPPGDTG